MVDKKLKELILKLSPKARRADLYGPEDRTVGGRVSEEKREKLENLAEKLEVEEAGAN